MILDPKPFQTRHIGPDQDEAASMLKAIGASSMDTLIDEAIPARIRLKWLLQLPARTSRTRIPPDAPRTGGENLPFRSYIGLGYYDLLHAQRDSSKRARKPVLVHAVHALSGRNCPGTAGSAPELSDHGARSHRHGSGDRLSARRSDSRRRSDDHAAPGPQPAQRAAAAAVFRRGFVFSADDRRPESAGRTAWHRARHRSARHGHILAEDLWRPGTDAGRKWARYSTCVASSAARKRPACSSPSPPIFSASR